MNTGPPKATKSQYAANLWLPILAMLRLTRSLANTSARSLFTPSSPALSLLKPIHSSAGCSTRSSIAISHTRSLTMSAPSSKDKTPGVPPQHILKEYEEHRVESAAPAEASIEGEHTFTHPKVSEPSVGCGCSSGWSGVLGGCVRRLKKEEWAMKVGREWTSVSLCGESLRSHRPLGPSRSLPSSLVVTPSTISLVVTLEVARSSRDL